MVRSPLHHTAVVLHTFHFTSFYRESLAIHGENLLVAAPGVLTRDLVRHVVLIPLSCEFIGSPP